MADVSRRSAEPVSTLDPIVNETTGAVALWCVCVFMSATASRDNRDFEVTMNAVIIYDEFDLAANSHGVLRKAANRADDASLWSIKPWRLDMLIRRATEGWGIGEVLGRVARARGGSNPNDGAYPGAVTARLLSGLEHQRVNRDIVVPAMLAFV